MCPEGPDEVIYSGCWKTGSVAPSPSVTPDCILRELLHPLFWFSGTISGNRRVWFYRWNLAEREASQPFPEPCYAWLLEEYNHLWSFPQALSPATHTYSTISLFLRGLSSLPCGLHFPLHTTNGFILYDSAEAFDISGHFLFPRMFFPLKELCQALPPPSESSFSASFIGPLPLPPSDPSVPVVSRVPCTAYFSLFLGLLSHPYLDFCR